ncbi:MAG: hypothetical protein GY765_38915 [bacterium]|nr:hypothetical protein [bacterium]
MIKWVYWWHAMIKRAHLLLTGILLFSISIALWALPQESPAPFRNFKQSVETEQPDIRMYRQMRGQPAKEKKETVPFILTCTAFSY